MVTDFKNISERQRDRQTDRQTERGEKKKKNKNKNKNKKKLKFLSDECNVGHSIPPKLMTTYRPCTYSSKVTGSDQGQVTYPSP